MHTTSTEMWSVHRAGCTGCDSGELHCDYVKCATGFAKTQKKGRGRRKMQNPFFLNPPSNVWLSYRVTTKEQCVFINRTLKLVYKCLWKEEKPNTCESSQALSVLVGHSDLQLSKLLPDRFSAVPGTEELLFSKVFTTTTTMTTSIPTTTLHSRRQGDLGLHSRGGAQAKPTPIPQGWAHLCAQPRAGIAAEPLGITSLSHCSSHLLCSAFSATESGISGGHSLKWWKHFRDVSHHVGLGLPKTELES